MLYNLDDDIFEYKNIASSNPEKVSELLKIYAKWNSQTIKAQWREGDKYAIMRKGEYLRFRDSNKPLQLSVPNPKKMKLRNNTK